MSAPAPLILLVEDDVLLRDAFRILLEAEGYRVVVAGTGAEALARSERERPSLVLLDLGLPDFPGLEIARRLKAGETTAAVPIVALTGRTGPAEERACLDAGCVHYVAKPIDPRKLLEQIPYFLE
ncbi:MAG TPA: response regulator [Longimicrobiales bacterium]|nr:response regulator [Longimicrobiales bacterium]